MKPICESNSRFAVKSVDAHADFALQPIENIRRTKAAALRPVCISSPIARVVTSDPGRSVARVIAYPYQGSVSNPSTWPMFANDVSRPPSPTRARTCAKGAGQGPRVERQERGLSVLPRALVRPGSGAQVRAGPRNKSGRALRSAAIAARDRARPQPRSIYHTVFNAGEHEKKGREPFPAPPLSALQYSSSSPPWTVCTTRCARCAGSAL